MQIDSIGKKLGLLTALVLMSHTGIAAPLLGNFQQSLEPDKKNTAIDFIKNDMLAPLNEITHIDCSRFRYLSDSLLSGRSEKADPGNAQGMIDYNMNGDNLKEYLTLYLGIIFGQHQGHLCMDTLLETYTRFLDTAPDNVNCYTALKPVTQVIDYYMMEILLDYQDQYGDNLDSSWLYDRLSIYYLLQEKACRKTGRDHYNITHQSGQNWRGIIDNTITEHTKHKKPSHFDRQALLDLVMVSHTNPESQPIILESDVDKWIAHKNELAGNFQSHCNRLGIGYAVSESGSENENESLNDYLCWAAHNNPNLKTLILDALSEHANANSKPIIDSILDKQVDRLKEQPVPPLTPDTKGQIDTPDQAECTQHIYSWQNLQRHHPHMRASLCRNLGTFTEDDPEIKSAFRVLIESEHSLHHSAYSYLESVAGDNIHNRQKRATAEGARRKPDRERSRLRYQPIQLQADSSMYSMEIEYPGNDLNIWKLRENIRSDVAIYKYDGKLEIMKRGFYLVYSQLTYYDNAGRWSHVIKKNGNNKKFLSKCLDQEWGNPVDAKTGHYVRSPYNCFTMTAVELYEGDELSIASLYGRRTIHQDSAMTFWGVIRLK